MDALYRVFFFGAAGLCLFLGLAYRLSALSGLALALLFLAVRAYLRARRLNYFGSTREADVDALLDGLRRSLDDLYRNGGK